MMKKKLKILIKNKSWKLKIEKISIHTYKQFVNGNTNSSKCNFRKYSCSNVFKINTAEKVNILMIDF